jgi:hypothetical protein
MAAPTEPSGRAGTKVFAALLAIFFLAVIGASAGYILGLRAKRAERHVAQQQQQPTPEAPTTPTGPTDTATTGNPGGGKPTATATRTSTPTASTPPTGRCLAETERDAKRKFGSPGGLAQVFYINTDLSEVWICRDSDGVLFYQGHKKSSSERNGGIRPPLRDLDNSLLLKTVASDGSGGYVAENYDSASGKTTRYLVSVVRLVIEYPDGRRETQPVTRHAP